MCHLTHYKPKYFNFILTQLYLPRRHKTPVYHSLSLGLFALACNFYSPVHTVQIKR